MNLIKYLRKLVKILNPEDQKMMLGRILCESLKDKKLINSLIDVEFKVFSQCGDDGIIQWLIHNIDFPNKTFIEFGVEDYRESNTRFLLMNDNWSGLVIDGSQRNIDSIISSEYFWRYELTAKKAFIDAENINDLIASAEFKKEVGILHIDLDGNDYWVWQSITNISPLIVIIEYNSVFGIDKPITVPYNKKFIRNKAHYSNLYFGASLLSLYQLSESKGYAFIGCNSTGNNAYFVRKDKLNNTVKEISLKNGYVASKFRESLDRSGKLNYLTGNKRLEAIKGMPIFNTDTNQIEEL
jgi:hypothetical protein